MKTTSTISLVLVCSSLLFAFSLAQSEAQVDALMEFYNSTNGYQWKNSSNWGTGLPCTQQWYGISCDDNNSNVIEINLTNNNLTGTIPESFGQLYWLQGLILSSNKVEGILPASFANLNGLTDLFLDENFMSGAFPELLFNLTALQQLSLGKNAFSGFIPDKFDSFPSLVALDLSENLFSGEVPPTILNHLENCYIYLGFNKLTSVPWDEWSNLNALSNSTLEINNNRITGTLPSIIYNIYGVGVDYNLFTGPFPELDVSNGVPLLRFITAAGNKLTGNLPVSLTKATNLASIFVPYNADLSGEIPVEFASMPNLGLLMFLGTGLTCPQDNKQWNEFEERAVTDCNRKTSSERPDYLGWYIAFFVTGVIFLLALAGLAVFFVLRSRRSKFETIA